jgi:hypothetical protein
MGFKNDSRGTKEAVFISYSHADQSWKNQLITHLTPWNIGEWSDSDIEVGARWAEHLLQILDSCQYAILLLSPDYLASDFIRKHELPKIVLRAETGSVRLICIHLRSNSFEATPLAAYQSVNDPKFPLNHFSGPALEAEVKRICKIVADLVRTQPQTSPFDEVKRNDAGREDRRTMTFETGAVKADRLRVTNLHGTKPPKGRSGMQVHLDSVEAEQVDITNVETND